MRYLPIVLFFAWACTEAGTGHEDAVRKVLAEQEAAWDHGDIPEFMAGYAEDACMIGVKGRTCGREDVTANYLKAYPDKASMGDLQFDVHEVLISGDDHAWCTGSWRLFRKTDTVGGGFSLFWRKDPAGWRIIRDHTY